MDSFTKGAEWNTPQPPSWENWTLGSPNLEDLRVKKIVSLGLQFFHLKELTTSNLRHGYRAYMLSNQRRDLLGWAGALYTALGDILDQGLNHNSKKRFRPSEWEPETMDFTSGPEYRTPPTTPSKKRKTTEDPQPPSTPPGPSADADWDEIFGSDAGSMLSGETPPKKTPAFFPDWARPFRSKATGSNTMMQLFCFICTGKVHELRTALCTHIFDEWHHATLRHSEDVFVLYKSHTKVRVSQVEGEVCKMFLGINACVVYPMQLKHYNAIQQGMMDNMLWEGEFGFNLKPLIPEQTTAVVNHVEIYEWAHLVKCTNVMWGMGTFLGFAAPPGDCTRCAREKDLFRDYETRQRRHYWQHQKYHFTATVYNGLRNQKKLMEEAIDHHKALEAANLGELTRVQEWAIFCKDAMSEMIDWAEGGGNLTVLKKNAYWLAVTGYKPTLLDPTPRGQLHSHWTTLMGLVHYRIVEALPKKRYIIFRGPRDTGKTTVANAIKDFCGGVTMNVNCNEDALRYEWGNALCKYMVLFEDVKGRPMNEEDAHLEGRGWYNLDSHREKLEGRVKCSLERKYVNSVQANFPPGIITMNNYYKIPPECYNRCVIVDTHKISGYDEFEKDVTEGKVNLALMSDKKTFMLTNLMYCSHSVDSWLSHAYGEKAPVCNQNMKVMAELIDVLQECKRIYDV